MDPKRHHVQHRMASCAPCIHCERRSPHLGYAERDLRRSCHVEERKTICRVVLQDDIPAGAAPAPRRRKGRHRSDEEEDCELDRSRGHVRELVGRFGGMMSTPRNRYIKASYYDCRRSSLVSSMGTRKYLVINGELIHGRWVRWVMYLLPSRANLGCRNVGSATCCTPISFPSCYPTSAPKICSRPPTYVCQDLQEPALKEFLSSRRVLYPGCVLRYSRGSLGEREQASALNWPSARTSRPLETSPLLITTGYTRPQGTPFSRTRVPYIVCCDMFSAHKNSLLY